MQTDADWGGCKETKHSTTGIVITINNTPVRLKSPRQSIVALSSSKAKHIVISSTARDLTWTHLLCWEVQFQTPFEFLSVVPTITILTNDNASNAIANQNGLNAVTKCIVVKYHHLKSLVAESIIAFRHISTTEQIADIFTKVVTRQVTEKLGPSIIGIVTQHFAN